MHRRFLVGSLVSLLSAVPAFASAADAVTFGDDGECTVTAGRLLEAGAGPKRPLRLKIPVSLEPRPGDDGVRAGPGSIIFMNKNGGTYYGANWEDSTSNQSTIVNGTDNVPAFPYSAAVW